MTFDDYQAAAPNTAHHNPDDLMDKTIWALGIAGESGEVVEKWKKIVAYKEGTVTPEDLQELGKEIGDVMWYLAMFADSLGLKLSDLAAQNLEKLASRKSRDVIKGAGDNR